MSILLVDRWHAMWNATLDDVKRETRCASIQK